MYNAILFRLDELDSREIEVKLDPKVNKVWHGCIGPRGDKGERGSSGEIGPKGGNGVPCNQGAADKIEFSQLVERACIKVIVNARIGCVFSSEKKSL